jgi:thioredoxin 1
MSRLIQSESEFADMLKTEKKILVLFYASWCPFCQRFLPLFEKHCAGTAGKYCRVVTDEVESAEDTYSIDVVPTVLCFENGEAVQRLDGIAGRGLNEKQLVQFLDVCGMADK